MWAYGDTDEHEYAQIARLQKDHLTTEHTRFAALRASTEILDFHPKISTRFSNSLFSFSLRALW